MQSMCLYITLCLKWLLSIRLGLHQTEDIATTRRRMDVRRKIHLKDEWYLVVFVFNEEKRLYIGKYDDSYNPRNKYSPTKFSVMLTIHRFQTLIAEMTEIDLMIDYVKSRPGEFRTIHLGGGVYASATHGYNCLNIRNFYKVCNFM